LENESPIIVSEVGRITRGSVSFPAGTSSPFSLFYGS